MSVVDLADGGNVSVVGASFDSTFLDLREDRRVTMTIIFSIHGEEEPLTGTWEFEKTIRQNVDTFVPALLNAGR